MLNAYYLWLVYIYGWFTLRYSNMAMEHGPFISDFPIETCIQLGDFPASRDASDSPPYRELLQADILN